MAATEKLAELSEAEKRQREDLKTEVRKANARIAGFEACVAALGDSVADAGARRKLEGRVEKEKAEIRNLERQIEDSVERQSAVDESLKIVSRKGKEPELRPNSMMARVREVIRQHGKPMTVVEIADALKLDKVGKRSVSGSLASYARDQRVFERKGPEVFTLIEFKESEKTENGN